MYYTLSKHLNQPLSFPVGVITELKKFHKFLDYSIPFSDIVYLLGYKESEYTNHFCIFGEKPNIYNHK